MKLAAAYAIAECIDENYLGKEYIVPSVFNKQVVRCVFRAVKEAAFDRRSCQTVPGLKLRIVITR